MKRLTLTSQTVRDLRIDAETAKRLSESAVCDVMGVADLPNEQNAEIALKSAVRSYVATRFLVQSIINLLDGELK